MTEVAIKAHDLLYLSIAIFEVANPKAVIQIIHGEREHKENYNEFCSWLNANGFNVVIADLRGHGKSINDSYPIGYLENIEELVKDTCKVTEFIKNRYPNLEVYMFAHAFGTEIARIYLEEN
ncbi:MAG: lysophospholipase, partial [Bacilli bacterium]|nr:lysophospholipase [Bacilli bacterium]